MVLDCDRHSALAINSRLFVNGEDATDRYGWVTYVDTERRIIRVRVDGKGIRRGEAEIRFSPSNSVEIRPAPGVDRDAWKLLVADAALALRPVELVGENLPPPEEDEASRAIRH